MWIEYNTMTSDFTELRSEDRTFDFVKSAKEQWYSVVVLYFLHSFTVNLTSMQFNLAMFTLQILMLNSGLFF